MIELKNITKSFDDFVALDDITLKIDNSSITGLIGYNGAGKTTLLKTAAGIYRPDSGTALLDGANAFDNNNERKHLFFVPDELWIPQNATLKSLSKYYADFYESFDRECLKKLIKLFELDENKRIRSFSKGMQRQAEIIIALSARPMYMLLDESFDGLDPQKRDIVKKLLLEYMAETGAALLIASHNLPELSDMCDRIALLNGKKLALNCDIGDVSENLRRVNIVFDREVSEDDFSDISHQKIRIEGKAASFLLAGDIEAQTEKLRRMNPVQLDMKRLSLEEVFLSETDDYSQRIGNIFKKD